MRSPPPALSPRLSRKVESCMDTRALVLHTPPPTEALLPSKTHEDTEMASTKDSVSSAPPPQEFGAEFLVNDDLATLRVANRVKRPAGRGGGRPKHP